ncbi:cytochrome P450 [Longispora sp. K20-0274]|uniref:cytochrome P450 n=1 Tax=Longispora sp. K20-0274 TaxID=3088255 RepID=UPI0039999F22
MTAWEERVQTGAHPVAYRMMKLIANSGPVRRVPRVGVVVSDPVLARRVLMDPDTFTKTGPGSPSDLWTPVLGPSVLLNMEGDAHTRLRRKLSGLFTPGYVGELCDRVLSPFLRDLREDLDRGREVDLVQVVRDCAGAVICELVGLPTDRVAEAYARGTAITSMVRLGRPRLTDRQIRHARTELGGLTSPAIRAYRAGDPSTVPGRMRELGLTEEEAHGAVGAFVLTGTETLVSYLPRLVALCHDTGVTVDESNLDRVVAEGLRYTVPSPVMLRSVARSSAIGGVPVRAGDRVVIATLFCARGRSSFDPTRAPDPDVRQLWFGAGPHFCLGAPLARAEIDGVLRALMPGRVTVTSRTVARRVLIPGYSRLMIRSV